MKLDQVRKTSLERMFHPRSVAVVGVSTSGDGFGSGIVTALETIGFEGKIYAVNPKGGEFRGSKIYQNPDEIPEPIDFAIIAVPAGHVPAVLEECRLKGAAGVEILSSGFSELGTTQGIRLEREIKEICSRGIRVVGPNCFGIYCPKSGLTLLPGPELSRVSGTVGFLSQSGGMSVDFAHIGKWMGVGFSKVVSFGNGADLRETEMLAYFEEDAETRIIAMYIEGIQDGGAFFSALKQVAREKPVILYKGGLSEAGGRAVETHTASMGGSAAIWESALRQCGVIQVTDLWEMAETCLAFSMLPERAYENITVAGGGGALGVCACDTAAQYGFRIPVLDPGLSEAILEYLPQPGSSAKNPIDAANPFVEPRAYREILLNAAKDDRIDLQILVQLMYHYKSLASGMGGVSLKDIVPYREMAAIASEVASVTGKPLMLVLPNIMQGKESLDIEEILREARKAFLDAGIPVFSDIRSCLRSLAHVSRFHARKKNETKKS